MYVWEVDHYSILCAKIEHCSLEIKKPCRMTLIGIPCNFLKWFSASPEASTYTSSFLAYASHPSKKMYQYFCGNQMLLLLLYMLFITCYWYLCCLHCRGTAK